MSENGLDKRIPLVRSLYFFICVSFMLSLIFGVLSGMRSINAIRHGITLDKKKEMIKSCKKLFYIFLPISAYFTLFGFFDFTSGSSFLNQVHQQNGYFYIFVITHSATYAVVYGIVKIKRLENGDYQEEVNPQ